MKERFFLLLITAITAFFVFACSEKEANEETLLLYTRAAGLYQEGRFSDAALMLADSGGFFPALLLKGKAEFLSGKDEAAEKTLRRVLAQRPGCAEALLCLARLLREKGEAGEAERLVEKILGDNSQDIRALRLAADLAREKGPAGEASAAAFLNRAVEASSEAALVFLDRARLRWAGGRGKEALEDLRRARELLPDDIPLVKSIEKLEAVIKEAAR
jgi:predicted Zn-dependent protease